MPEIPAIPIRKIVEADCTADGNDVLFQLESETGQLNNLACHVDVATQIVFVLSAALQKAEKRRGEGGELSPGIYQRLRGLIDPKTTVGYDKRLVTLSLYPMDHLGLHLGFSPGYSRKLCKQLEGAIAKAEAFPSKHH